MFKLFISIYRSNAHINSSNSISSNLRITYSQFKTISHHHSNLKKQYKAQKKYKFLNTSILKNKYQQFRETTIHKYQYLNDEFINLSKTAKTKYQEMIEEENKKKILLKYMALYNSAISELLEGRREVMQNKKFQFEDGETVEQKVARVETVLKSLVARTEKQLKNIENKLDQ